MATIMLTKENSNYEKSLNYYYIQHFSKFIKPNAKIIEHSKYSRNISVLSAKNPDNSIVIVILNDSTTQVPFNLIINNNFLKDKIKPNSIITYLMQ
jgi:glucosylceramidase